MHTKFWQENLKERDHLEDKGTEGSIILECNLKQQAVRMWNGFIWLRVSPSGSLL
jgi:hypothetical protein